VIKAVIFDLDGTLVDSVPDLQASINAMLTRLGYRTKTRTEVIKALNNGAVELVRRCLPRDVQGVDFILQSALDTYRDEYSNRFLDETRPYSGIEAMLLDLRSMGIRICVLSNKPDPFVKDIISTLFDRKLFSHIQGQDKLPVKPNPTSTLAIAKSLGVKPSRCIFVGDSDVDMQTGKNAGMRTVGASWGYRGEEVLREAGADFVIKEPNELIDIIKSLYNEKKKRKENAKLRKQQKLLAKQQKSEPINETDNEQESQDAPKEAEESIT